MRALEWVKGLPPELATFLIAALPVSELRGAIPVALSVYGLPLWSALLWAILGNMAPVPWILLVLDPVARFLSRWRVGERFFAWLFARTRRRGESYLRLYRELGLVLFVAIPLPMTGAWTGAVLAFLFGVPFWRALWLLFTGVTVAALIVTLATLGVGFFALLVR
ncbi:MAG: COG2426 family protein [Candidatus Methylomirabilales bacterium]